MSPAWCGHQTETANSRYGLTNVSNKANKILGMLSRTFTYFDVDLVKSLNSTTIEAILKVFGLTTLAKRRERGDLIQLYKIVNGLDTIHWESTTTLQRKTVMDHGVITRGHPLKLTARELVKCCEQRHNFSLIV